jgi:hypothetical protein
MGPWKGHFLSHKKDARIAHKRPMGGVGRPWRVKRAAEEDEKYKNKMKECLSVDGRVSQITSIMFLEK